MRPAELVTPAGLAARRRALNLTQRELGDVLGVPRNTIARWERGDLRVARPGWLELALAALEARASANDDALRSTSQHVNEALHLPAELSSFVGRNDEVAECRALLRERRLVTLTGVGGIGKSRLASQVARAAAADFADGVYLIELAGLEDPSFVMRAVATSLGIAERAGYAVIDVLIGVLRWRRLLLIMDDCDRVVRECARVAHQLLRGAPSLSIIATCREPLDVPGEIVWRVPPLKLPTSQATGEEICKSEAVQLFVERARLVAPWFKLTETNAPRVAYLCRRLDGIPLALELAAARLKALDLGQLVARLEHSLEFLTGGSRTAPSRQQTLRATIDWSYRLLNQHERVLFRRLSVFAGGWSVEAAERVTAGSPLAPGETLPLLERLIDKSLVVTEERSGRVRQSMLDTLREYARERLVEAGEEPALRRRHFESVLDTVEAINPEFLSPELVAERSMDMPNLRASLTWCIQVNETELGLRLAGAAGKIWHYRGFFAEGLCWLNRMLQLPGAADLRQLRKRALKWSGALSYELGDMYAARASIAQASALHADGDEREPPVCSQLLANIARATGDLDGALQLFLQALDEYHRMGLRFWEEVNLFYISSVLFEKGDRAGSRAACDRCLALGQGSAFTWATSRARIILAYLAETEADASGAERLSQQALTQLRAIADPSGIGMALRALGQFALEDGRLSRAWTYLAEAMDIACTEGDRMALARTLETLACVLAAQAPEHAAQIAGAASGLRTRTGTVPWPTEQERLTRRLGHARDDFGAQAFDASYKIGQRMSEMDTISAARRFADDALTSHARNGSSVPDSAPLTARQQEVAVLVAQGLTNEQIAQQLVISPATARAHIEHVLARLDLHSRAQVAAWAAEHHLVTSSGSSSAAANGP